MCSYGYIGSAPMRGNLSAQLRDTDIVRIATSQWRREWETKEVAKLVAVAQKDGRAVNLKRLEVSVRARKLTAGDRIQRDKKVKAALKEHQQIFGELKQKREHDATASADPGADAPAPKKRRVSGEKGLLSENLKENVVLDAGAEGRGSRSTRGSSMRSKAM